MLSFAPRNKMVLKREKNFNIDQFSILESSLLNYSLNKTLVLEINHNLDQFSILESSLSIELFHSL